MIGWSMRDGRSRSPGRGMTAMALVLIATLSACMPMMAGPALGSAPASATHAASPLAAQLEEIFADPLLAHAQVGVAFRSLDSGETLYEREARRLFVPASNMKLVSGAAALWMLGPEYRYRTQIAAGGQIRNGVLDGPLIITGTGDPTFSDRFNEDSRDPIRMWADSLRARGITRVAGGVIAVDTAFYGPDLGPGWAWDDLDSGFSASFGALQFNENVITIDVFPSSTTLSPAIVVLSPSTQYVRILNDTRTMPAGSQTAIQLERDPASSAILLTGQIAADSEGLDAVVAVRDPALYAATVIRETLREEGVLVEGPALRYSPVDPSTAAVGAAMPLFEHHSPRLAEILAGTMKPSQNLIAETLLLTTGREIRGQGTTAAGVAVADSLLRSWNILETGMRMVDGSGLSRYNLLSPSLLLDLLELMDDSPYRESWLSSLAVGGRDGTLAGRMRDPPLLDSVAAKSGTLTGIRSLSGYLTTESGERIAFSVMVNNHLQTGSMVDGVVERALELVATSR